MTSPSSSDPRRLDRINPSKTIHNPPPEVPSVRRLTTRQVGVIGTVIVDLILAQVALALGGINILGVKPFAFLTTWGQEIQVRAADAFNKAMASEAVANSSEATSAVALGQVAVTKEQVQEQQIGLQTTWNGLWEASTNTVLPPGQNKSAQDVKNGQIVVREIAVQGATGASGANANVQSTWNNIYNGAFNTSVSNATLSDVFNTNRTIVIRTGTSETNQGVLGGNIQSTWDSIYVAAGGTGPTTNRTLSDAQQRILLLNNTAYGASGSIYLGWRRYYQGITGIDLETITADDVLDAGENTSDTLEDHDERINELETERDGSTFSGSSSSINFTNYSVGALPNPPWTTTVVSGSNGASINSAKQAAWTGSSVGRVTFIQNVQTLTDYQRVTTSVADWGFGRNYVYGRSNASGTSAIVARTWIEYSLSSGFTLVVQLWNGTSSLLKEERVSPSGIGANWAVTLLCGVQINNTSYPRKYRIFINNTLMLDHDDTANVTAAVTGRFSGFGLEAVAGNNNTLNRPSPVSAWSMSDNVPATYLGAGMRAARTSSTGSAPFGLATAGAVWPASVLATDPVIPPNTDVMTYSSQRVTAKVAGWYVVNIGLKVDQLINLSFHYLQLGVYVNGAAHTWGAVVPYDQFAVTAVVYLNKDDYVEPGFRTNFDDWNAIGNAAGTLTYFTVSFLNNTKPSNPKATTA